LLAKVVKDRFAEVEVELHLELKGAFLVEAKEKAVEREETGSGKQVKGMDLAEGGDLADRDEMILQLNV
jgi:hypothetical protein